MVFFSTLKKPNPILVDSSFVSSETTHYVYFENVRVVKDGYEIWSLMHLVSSIKENNMRVYTDIQASPNEPSLIFHYVDPNPSSYYFKKRDNPAVLVSRNRYKKQFEQLFSDCDYLLHHFKKIKWDQIEEHVNFYCQKCK